MRPENERWQMRIELVRANPQLIEAMPPSETADSLYSKARCEVRGAPDGRSRLEIIALRL